MSTVEAKERGKKRKNVAGCEEGSRVERYSYAFEWLGLGPSNLWKPTFDETPAAQTPRKPSKTISLAELVDRPDEVADEELVDDAQIRPGEVIVSPEKASDPVSPSRDKVETSPEKGVGGSDEGGHAVTAKFSDKPSGEGPNLSASGIVVGLDDNLMTREAEALAWCGFKPVGEEKKALFFQRLDAFKQSQYLINGLAVPNQVFREIVEKTVHVSTDHMELMLSLIWFRLRERLADSRAVVLDTHFIEHLRTDDAKRKQKRAKPFKWNKNVMAIVNGVYGKREGKTKWLVDVDRVYTPMNWSDCHWVGLCIDLVTGTVTVFDSLINLHKEEKVVELMGPALETLPLLVADLEPQLAAEYEPPSSFVYKRPRNVVQNARTGDCGPLAVKYMELHSQGFPLDGITDEMVDNLRLNYAIDIYETFWTSLA